jgi:dihydroorotase-like cyclic amidohydrolase
MEKLSLVSRHIVLVNERLPVYGAILILGDKIHSIERYDTEVPISMIMERLYEWHPVNLENHYISPGIIDMETYVSRETGGYATATECAIKGGVTLIVEHPNPHYDPVDP